MELMDSSLHQLYKLVHEKLKRSIPEDILGKMAESVRQGLECIDLGLSGIVWWAKTLKQEKRIRYYAISGGSLKHYIYTVLEYIIPFGAVIVPSRFLFE